MTQRPTAITVICVLGFIGAAITIPLAMFSASSGLLPGWYTPYLLLSAAVGLACMIGMWKMKKAAALGYVAFTGVNQLILLVAGMWSIGSLVIPAVVCGIALSNLNKME